MNQSSSPFKAFKRSLRSLLIGASVLALATTVGLQSAQAQAKQITVRGSLAHIHGVNLPWIVNSGGSNYGHDIGPNNFTGYGYNYNSNDVNTYFADIKKMHCNTVRIWLFEELEGLNFDSSGNISGINTTFMTNLADVVQKANNNGLALELTLFSFGVGNNFGKYPNKGGGAVKNFFTDYNAQQALINNVVKPLVTKFNWNWGVYSYDLMNEANYAVSPFSGVTASANWSQMHSWVYNLSAAIHSVNSSIQVTCSTDDANSFASGNHWNRFGGAGLNYYEYHNYSDSPNLWTYGSGGTYPSIDKPLVLGEYGARTTGNDSLQGTVTDAFVNQASYKNWAGSQAWSYATVSGDVYSVVYTPNNWKTAAWTLQWYGINKFGT